MSYYIHYSGSKRKMSKRKHNRRHLYTIGFFFLFLLLVRLLAMDYLRELWQIWSPEGYIENLVVRLQSGEDLVDAVASFWEGMIHGG